MILYEGGKDISIRVRNTSRVYSNGRVHPTNNSGDITIIAQLDKYYLTTKGYKDYRYFIVQFGDGTKVEVEASAIRHRRVKNPNHPSVCKVGFLGQGVWLSSIKGVLTKNYSLWQSMLERCYSENTQNKYPTYKGCIVDKRWHCFQNFAEDLLFLDNYASWHKDSSKRNNYELDKDIKVKGNKLYSKDTCKFVKHSMNVSRYNKKQDITGLTYIATRLSDGHMEEFTNQTEFAEKYAFHQVYISMCVTGKISSHGGWVFQVKGR